MLIVNSHDTIDQRQIIILAHRARIGTVAAVYGRIIGYLSAGSGCCGDGNQRQYVTGNFILVFELSEVTAMGCQHCNCLGAVNRATAADCYQTVGL